MEEQIRTATAEVLEELDVHKVRFAVEWPADMAHGDYAVNAALAAAKALGKNPKDLASQIALRLREKLGSAVASIDVAGPGFINITLSAGAIAEQLALAKSGSIEWGKGSTEDGKRVIIEFSCPNPFKEMHIGHLMSTIIGESVSRITEFSGAKVCRDTYGGDVGPHVAKALWGMQDAGITEPTTAEELGKAYAHGSRAYEESDEIKQKIDSLNTEIYKGEDRELMELWRKGRDVSVEAFRELYRILDTHFDYYFFESETASIGLDVVRDGIVRGVFEESEGAVIYPGEKKGLHTLVFITSRGTPTYEAKDVGLAFLKEERWTSDESLIITAAEQIGHFTVFLAALSEIAPLLAAKTKHVPHGFLRLTSGKMSSREGNVVTAASLIRTVIEKALERNDDPLIAEQVALGAIKYSILKSSAGSDITFDMEKSLSLEGDSGPYLQYALVRAKSVLAQASLVADDDTATPEVPFKIERLLTRFPEVVASAQKFHAPHTIVQYLTQLAGEWNSFYANERIVGGTYETHKRGLASAFITTMHNGLHLLGIATPERM